MLRSSSARRGFALALLSLTLSCDDRAPLAPVPAPFFDSADLPPVRISEFHYDNTGTDAGEAIEVSSEAGMSFAGWSIVLYNGSGGAVYDTDPLPLTAPTLCGDRQVIVLNYPANGIQNGSPDGIALVGPSGLVEFLSYEGPFTAVGGPANGTLSTDVGVSEAGNEPLGLSLSRNGSGAWSGPAANTFGACNDSQAPAAVADVTVSPASATIVVGGAQQFTAAGFDASANPIPSTFTWTSTDESIATVSATGLATGVAAGDVGIIAAAPNGVADTAELQVEEPPPDPPAGPVFLSEIHYDNTGADQGEAIEVEGPGGLNLTGWTVVLYNLTNGASYQTVSLAGVLSDQCAGRGVASFPAVGSQNGPQDGLALVRPDNSVVEFLSYEGTLTATNGPALGLTSTDIGVDEDGDEPVGRSLQKFAGSWYGPLSATFGACNGPPPPPTLAIFGRSAASDPPLPVGFQAQLFAAITDASGNTVPTAITWSTETPGLASVDADGVFTALAEGTAILRATGADGTTSTISLPTRVAIESETARYAGNAEFGEPADGDPADDFILRHRQLTSSFSYLRGTPNWVSYEIEATHFGPEDRCNCFTFDPDLPAEFERYTTAAYTGASAFHQYGIDRGHLARSFDRTAGSLDNARTFLFSNIIPQASDNNQGPWSDLESVLGDLARLSNKEVYVVAGVAGSKGTVKDEGRIVIPAQTWKVALVLPRDRGLADVQSWQDIEQVIAVIMPNDAGLNPDWTSFRTTVNAVEGVSGYDLLALLDDVTEGIIESGDRPPVADAGGPYAGFEGSAVTFDASGSSDPDEGDALSYAWDFGDGTTGSGVSSTHTYAVDGSYTVTLTVTDSYGATGSASAGAVISNANPVITGITLPAAPLRVGNPASVTVTFTDAGAGDTHTTTIDWGDGSSSSSSTHAYGAAGLYFVSATVTDDDGGSHSAGASGYIVVTDPNGMAAGAGTYGTAPNRGAFAFQARYLGNRPFAVIEHLNRIGLFSATSTEWVVVTGNKVIVRGAGAIGRTRGYQFLMVGIAGSPDGFRLKIWNAAGIVYDNQPDQPDHSDAVSQLTAGDIQVRR